MSPLLQEVVWLVLLAYLFLLGGSYNGLVVPLLFRWTWEVLFIAGGAWLLWRRHARRPFPFTAITLWGTGILAAAALATLASVLPRLSLERLYWLLLYWLLFHAVVDLLRAGWAQDALLKALLAITIVVLFFGCWELGQWYLGWHAALGRWGVPLATYRARSLFGHPNLLASYLVVMWPIALTVLWGNGQSVWRRGWSLLWGGLAMVLLLFTSSRGGWAAWAGMQLFWGGALAFVQRRRLVRWWGHVNKARLLLALLAAAGGFFWIWRSLLSWLLQNPSHPSGGWAVAPSRFYIWKVALQAWQPAVWFGRGPGTFGLFFLRTVSVPPEMLLAHAHSVPLQVLAEMGLVGVGLLLGLGGAVLLRMARLGRRPPSAVQKEIAVAAALVGGGIHSLVETPVIVPAHAVLWTVCLAMIFAGEDRWPGKAWGSEMLLRGVYFVMLLVGGWRVMTDPVYFAGLKAAAAGRWEEASIRFDRAMQMDPSFVLYWQQSAFAHGWQALDTGGTLRNAQQAKQAVALYERALQIEPAYAVPWANQAVLWWALGERRRAIAAMQAAVARAPRQARFWATLGGWYEQTGNPMQALAAYRRALEERPAWRHAPFFTAGSALRRRALREALFPATALHLAWETWLAGRSADAQIAFARLVGLNQGEAYLGLGMAQAAHRQWRAAQRSLAIAGQIGLTDWAAVRLQVAQADVALGQGDCRSAITHDGTAFSLATSPTSFEWAGGSQDYAWYIFYRQALGEDLLPGFAPVLPEEFLAAMQRMARCYQQMGDPLPARHLHTWVQRQRALQSSWPER